MDLHGFSMIFHILFYGGPFTTAPHGEARLRARSGLHSVHPWPVDVPWISILNWIVYVDLYGLAMLFHDNI